MDRKLLTLLKVIETGSFVAAAQALEITQPAVSLQIRQLESDYGKAIFTRSGGKLTLTDCGKQIARYAELMLKMDAELRTEIERKNDTIREIRIGMNQTFETGPFPEALATIAASDPKVRFNITASTTKDLYRKLEDGELDICIVGGHMQNPAIQFIDVDFDVLTLIVSPENPLAHKDRISFSEITDIPMILRPLDSGTNKLLGYYMETLALSISNLRTIMYVNNVCTIKELVRKNYGVSILTKSACQYEIANGSLVSVPIEDISSRSEISIVLSSRAYANAEKVTMLQDLAHEIKRVYKSLL